MKNLFRILRKFWPLALVGIILWLFFAFYRPFEPHYRMRPLSYWATDVYSPFLNPKYHNPTNDLRVDAIRHIGTNALPFAIKFCSVKESTQNEKVVEWVNHNGEFTFKGTRICWIQISTAWDMRDKGTGIFAALGPMAKPAIPDLIKLLGNEDSGVANSAANGLEDIGPDAIPALIDALTNQNQSSRFFAASSLGHMTDTTGNLKTAIRPAIPALMERLNDKDPFVEGQAAWSLGRIQQDATTVIPALIEALKRGTNFSHQEFESLSFGVLEGISDFHTNAQPAIPFLVECIGKGGPITAAAALDTLGQIAPEVAETYIERVNNALTNPPPDDSVSNLFYNGYGPGSPANFINPKPSVKP